MSTVTCRNLTKAFDNQPVVAGVSFDVQPGQILALLGPSGCGKTTTLRLIAGFEQLDGGLIEIDGQVVADGRTHIPPEKRRAGIVFQDYAIFPHLSVAENVGFGLDKQGRAERVAEMLEFVGLPGLGERMPHELSGGQQQRVALARALAPQPVVLLLDEPFSNLDAALRAEMRREVRQLLKRGGVTAVFVTHDQEEALFMGDTVAVMNRGRIEQIGTPEAIFHRPKTRFVADFLGNTDFVPGVVTPNGIETPLGLLPQRPDLPPGTAVTIAARPDDVRLVADAAGNGRVTNRRFIGIAFIYEVTLAEGTVVHSWQSHQTQLAEGTAVQSTFDDAHSLVVFAGETAVGG
ncbi:MAG: ABC transporter [Chloroflexota bacterium]|nr:ABC transporter ATP-binding protein [Ardenticatenaceae bacterium]GIK58336.1 MAG: ABC transporter [Chloroflexota bacterium]